MKSRIETILDDFPGGALNFAVWLAASAGAVAILSSRVAHVEYIGIASAIEHEVSVAGPGTVSDVLVRVYDDVEKGQLVAVLDDRHVSATLAVAATQLDGLQRALDSALGVRGTAGVLSADVVDWMSERRRFEVDVENRRLDAIALVVEIETDRVDEQRLRLKLERAEPLNAQGAISLDEYDDIRLTHAALVTRIDEKSLLLQRTREELAAATRRRDAYVGVVPDNAGRAPVGAGDQDPAYLAMLRGQIELQEKRVAEIATMRAALTVRAPIAGRVAYLGARSGQAVDVGEAIATIARTDSSDIVAWLPEGDARKLDVGQAVWVRSGEGMRLAESFIERVAPTVAVVPARLWRNPDYPEYGRAVVVAAVDGLDLVPGASVRVRFF